MTLTSRLLAALVAAVAGTGLAGAGMAADAGAASYATLKEARAHAGPAPSWCAQDGPLVCIATFFSDPAGPGGARTWRVGPWVAKPAAVCLDQATASQTIDCDAPNAFPTATMIRPVEPPRPQGP